MAVLTKGKRRFNELRRTWETSTQKD
ncbi:hypothetical protein [Bacillus swezeyi]|nr:hypothetical protein [Bacillus swezeyi]